MEVLEKLDARVRKPFAQFTYWLQVRYGRDNFWAALAVLYGGIVLGLVVHSTYAFIAVDYKPELQGTLMFYTFYAVLLLALTHTGARVYAHVCRSKYERVLVFNVRNPEETRITFRLTFAALLLLQWILALYTGALFVAIVLSSLFAFIFLVAVTPLSPEEVERRRKSMK